MGAFDDDAFATTAFSPSAFAMDTSPPTPSGGSAAKRHHVRAAVVAAVQS